MMALTKFKIESGVQLLARLNKKPIIENFYPTIFQPGLKHHDVVEIFGNISSSYLIIDLIIEALIPSTTNVESIGVLIFNTAGQLNITELITILKKRIVSSKNTNPTETDSVLHKTLKNLFILDLYDATQFYVTIYNLENILNKHQNISLLIFDTLTAFYWGEQGFNKITKMDLYVKNLLRMILKVSKEYKVILIYTRPGYFGSSGDLETSDIQISDCINFKVQVIDSNATGSYQVIIRTLDSLNTKYFSILDNQIKWQ